MDIIERIKKLHALSERNSSTEEAASAANKIQELCFAHNLELSKVLGTPEKEAHPYDRHYYVAKASRNNFGWHKVLFHGIVQTNFCYDLITPGTTRFTIIGQKHNVDAIIYTYEYLVREIERLAVEHCAKQGYFNGKLKREYLRAFCQGASSEIQRILRRKSAEREKSTEESTALVVVKSADLKKAVTSFYPNCRMAGKKVTWRGSSTSGAQDGRAAAAGISLNRGVGSIGRALIGKSGVQS